MRLAAFLRDLWPPAPEPPNPRPLPLPTPVSNPAGYHPIYRLEPAKPALPGDYRVRCITSRKPFKYRVEKAECRRLLGIIPLGLRWVPVDGIRTFGTPLAALEFIQSLESQ